MSILGDMQYAWYKDRVKHGHDASDEAFEDYINSLSNFDLIRELLYAVETAHDDIRTTIPHT